MLVASLKETLTKSCSDEMLNEALHDLGAPIFSMMNPMWRVATLHYEHVPNHNHTGGTTTQGKGHEDQSTEARSR